VTFKYLSTVDERAPTGNGASGIREPFIRHARDGTTLQCFYSSENADDDQDSLMRTSTDGCETWSAPQTISGEGVTARDGMLGVAPINNDDDLIAVFETTEHGRFTISSVKSRDDGRTWSERTDIYVPANGKEAGAPQVVNVWGTLVASFMTNEDGPDRPGVIDGSTKILTSTDGGSTWGNKFTVFPPDANCPGVALLDQYHLNVMAGLSEEGAVSQTIELTCGENCPSD